MLNKIKRLIKGDRKLFHHFCRSNDLELNYELNKNEVGILRNIFEDREYADYFPFYRQVTIVDIGAHYGYFSIFASKNTNPLSRIISFEPNNGNFKSLVQNSKDCQVKNIVASHCAIGGVSGLTKLYAGFNPNHSIVVDYKLLHEHKAYEEVAVKTLEEIVLENKLSKIDFLKIDCEGAEYSILENTPDAIFDRITTISMEFHDLNDARYTGDTIVELLIKKGFQIVKYQYDKTTMNLNYGKIIGTKLLSDLKK